MQTEQLIAAADPELRTCEARILRRLQLTVELLAPAVPAFERLQLRLRQLPEPDVAARAPLTDAVLLVLECLKQSRADSPLIRQLHKQFKTDFFRSAGRSRPAPDQAQPYLTLSDVENAADGRGLLFLKKLKQLFQ